MARITSGQRPRTCRACGRKFEYPVKECPATRHHCADCVEVPPRIRQTFERLNTRIAELERQLKQVQKPATPAS